MTRSDENYKYDYAQVWISINVLKVTIALESTNLEIAINAWPDWTGRH